MVEECGGMHVYVPCVPLLLLPLHFQTLSAHVLAIHEIWTAISYLEHRQLYERAWLTRRRGKFRGLELGDSIPLMFYSVLCTLEPVWTNDWQSK